MYKGAEAFKAQWVQRTAKHISMTGVSGRVVKLEKWSQIRSQKVLYVMPKNLHVLYDQIFKCIVFNH